MAKFKCNPYVSVITGRTTKGGLVRRKIRINYEPEKTRAGAGYDTLIAVTINGKRYKRRLSAIYSEYDL